LMNRGGHSIVYYFKLNAAQRINMLGY